MNPVTDPVSGFVYPASWLEHCSAEDRLLADSGFAVLTSDGRALKRGVTTGAPAAAAV